MWNPSRWLIVAGCLLATGTAQAAPAAWCEKDAYRHDFKTKDLDHLRENPTKSQLLTLVQAQCSTNVEGDAALIPKAVADWSNRSGMTADDWADAVSYLNDKYASPPHGRSDDGLSSAWSPLDQWFELSTPANFNTKDAIDANYLTDTLGDKLTQLGRAGYLSQCVESKIPSQWAICQDDLDALDRNKLFNELRADKNYNATQKIYVRLRLVELWDKVDAHVKDVKAIQAKDPAYVQMFKVASSARTDWAKQVDPALVELVHAMDDARASKSRKAGEGCEDKTWQALRGRISAIPAKTFANLSWGDGPTGSPLSAAMDFVVHTPNGYLAALAYHSCAAVSDNRDFLVRTIGDLMYSWPGYRGPRNAAYSAIASAGLQLDERGATIDYPRMARRMEPLMVGGGGAKGTIAKVEVKGAETVVTFTTQRSKERQCGKGHSTHHIRAFDTSGDPVFEYICEKWTTVTVESTPSDPIAVPSRYAVGLKKGMAVEIDEVAVGFAYAKAGATVPVIVAGAPVK